MKTELHHSEPVGGEIVVLHELEPAITMRKLLFEIEKKKKNCVSNHLPYLYQFSPEEYPHLHKGDCRTQ